MKFLILFLLVVLSACVPQAEKKTSCAVGETFQESSRRCIASVTALATPSPIQQVPVVNTSQVSYSSTPTEDTAFIATLAYSDANFDPGLSCVIPSVSGLNITSICACSNGICTVAFQANANANGAASFSYRIIDNDGQSLPGTVNLVIQGVDDIPTVPAATVVNFNEDALTQINLAYADIEGDIATSCQAVSTNVNLTFPLGCNCIAGICSVYAQGGLNYNTASSIFFNYRVFTNTSWSAYGSYSVTINALNDAPVGTNFATSTNEDTAQTVTFTLNSNYTDPESDQAINFNIYNQTNVVVTPSSGVCVAGVCTVSVTPNSNLNSPTSNFSFDYTLTDATLTSVAKTVTLTVTPVDDLPVGLPVASSLSPASPVEDTAVTVTLSYTDVDQDLATACTITNTNVGNGTAGACTCSGTVYPNSCSFVFTPAANINGASVATFSYAITAGLGTSTAVPVAFSISAVNDAPTISAISDVVDNEASTIIINNIQLDEGGGVDENTQIVSVSVSSDNPTLVSNGQVAINFTDIGDASNSPLSLTITPTGGTSGVANITVSVSDNGTPVQTTTRTFKITINNSSFIHNGWKNLKALGAKTNANGGVLENPSVTLQWEDFTPQGSATLNGFKVYRATSPGGQDFNNPLACNSAVNSCADATTVSSSVNTFIDSLPSNIGSGVTYYYVVRPVDGNNIATVTSETYSEIDVPIPPSNMSLVHRWLANKETCTKMGQTIDMNNHFRCVYSGPGSIGGFYDFGAYYSSSPRNKKGHLFVDRFEAGCNYSLAPTCTSNGCIGNGDPATIGCNGSNCNTAALQSVFYDRTSGTCYRKTAASTWTAFDSTFVTALGNTLEPNKAHLPPLLKVNATDAQAYCAKRAKRLMTRKEQVAMSAWDESVLDATVTTLESGLSMATNSSCNTMSAAGMTYSNGQLPTTGNEDSLPATLSSSLRTVRTGSAVTASCSSKYGIQDLIGNVREWTIEQFNDCTVGVSVSAQKATRSVNGLRFTAKRLGTSGNFIQLNFSPSVANIGNETITVVKTSDIVINMNVSPSANAASLYNLLQTNAEVLTLVDIEVLTPTTSIASLSSYLALGNNGAADTVTPLQAQLTSTEAQSMTITSDIYGIHGNDITLTIVDGSALLVEVNNGKDIVVTINSGVTNTTSIQAAINAHSYASALVTAAGATGAVATSMATIALHGGRASNCTSITSGIASYYSPATSFLNDDLESYDYRFYGDAGSGNGPGGTTYNISSWLLGNTDANPYSSDYIHLPTGMPSISSIFDSVLIGGGQLPATSLFGDQIDVNADPETFVNLTTQYGNSRSLAFGGAWYGAYDRSTQAVGVTGNKAGRYAADLLPPTLSDNYTGFRCVVEAP